MSYRESHLDKGAIYDETLAESPFDDYMARREAEFLTRFVQQEFAGRVDRYLDFACGTGRILSTVAPYSAKSYGLDISDSMANKALEKCPETEFHIGDFTTQESPVEPVDLVTSFRFLGNAEPTLRRMALVAINGFLRPGGYLVTNNHRNPNALPVLMHKLTGCTEDLDLSHSKLKRLLRETGFSVVATHCIGLWAFRHSLCTRKRLESSAATFLEKVVRVPGQAHICPDVILVARKVADV